MTPPPQRKPRRLMEHVRIIAQRPTTRTERRDKVKWAASVRHGPLPPGAAFGALYLAGCIWRLAQSFHG
jgi:hypothetical protein